MSSNSRTTSTGFGYMCKPANAALVAPTVPSVKDGGNSTSPRTISYRSLVLDHLLVEARLTKKSLGQLDPDRLAAFGVTVEKADDGSGLVTFGVVRPDDLTNDKLAELGISPDLLSRLENAPQKQTSRSPDHDTCDIGVNGTLEPEPDQGNLETPEIMAAKPKAKTGKRQREIGYDPNYLASFECRDPLLDRIIPSRVVIGHSRDTF